MRTPMICVHALNGRPMFVRLGKDKVLLSKKPVVAIIRDQRYEVREDRKEIEGYIRDA
jgi:hypothetical protein